ncbi:site-specific DNA-methyltransferase [Prosthecobacter fluviatilis]|uniref:site-specific DNA-methyltransferase (adenine-specific) n=1 Tax=Prosthecobacter fluviatilis TaxID=445931 RepID=A0ABW0KRP0_9BACT
MIKKQKLELTWIGKEHRPKLEPRILLEEPDKSCHAAHRVTDRDLFDNRLIHGDNLLALKALEQDFAGKVKCIYIDPPFNTQQAFEHYDDSTEHSDWLRLIRDRAVILHRLLATEGTLFVHIDDNELGYLTVLLDEIFGRGNRVAIVTFKQGSATGHKSINPGCVSTTNFILIYAKKKASWTPNRVFTARERDDRYGQFIENIEAPFEQWTFTTLMKAFAGHMGLSDKDARALAKSEPEKIDDFVVKHAHRVIRTARPSYDGVSAEARRLIDESKRSKERILKLQRDGYSDIYLKGGERLLFYSDKLKSIDGKFVAGEPLTTLWDDVLSNNLHAEGAVEFPKSKKPEALIKRVLDLATNPGDLVLDSFLGSGTTAAVAHKMGRRWIGIELGEHCETHCLPRLKKVVDGADPGGITEAVGWKGGGGFRYYRLAPSLLLRDKWDQLVINPEYNAPMLAEAVCKLEGFTYAPSDTVYWQQGHSTEQDFIYTTTANLSHAQLQQLSDEVGPERSLLVVCSAFRGRKEGYSNLTVKKIPKAVLTRCEWGKDDYSLKVENLPQAPAKPGQMSLFDDDGGAGK